MCANMQISCAGSLFIYHFRLSIRLIVNFSSFGIVKFAYKKTCFNVESKNQIVFNLNDLNSHQPGRAAVTKITY